MVRFQAFASGSNGNCIYLGDGDTHVLIDCGISCKRVTEGLLSLGVTTESLSGILITHEHWDHIQGLFVFAKNGCPIYATEETISMIRYADKKHQIPDDLYRPVEPGEPFQIGTFSALPVPTHHDAANPVSYRISTPSGSFGVLTDTGHTDCVMTDAFSGLTALLLESNHDVRMLEVGRYPYALKRRILGRNGHLSNESAAAFVKETAGQTLKLLILGHLSEENNLPELARLETENVLDAIEEERKDPNLRLVVASRYEPTEAFMFGS
ncbi:MAG: MBL fold metallo-hydrolase [Lachnospiraceae bacterium]|nr:MBL fold metallo-hydrolase [Lachnospiraceae bacterium]